MGTKDDYWEIRRWEIRRLFACWVRVATTAKAVGVKSVNGFKAYDQCIILLLTRVALGLSITFMCYGVKKWPL